MLSVAGVLETVGPFAIPVVLFAGGVLVYALLWYYQRLRDGSNG